MHYYFASKDDLLVAVADWCSHLFDGALADLPKLDDGFELPRDAHMEQEQRHGRRCPADWSWIVPPTAGSTTPVFHRSYHDFDASPNFRRHAG